MMCILLQNPVIQQVIVITCPLHILQNSQSIQWTHTNAWLVFAHPAMEKCQADSLVVWLHRNDRLRQHLQPSATITVFILFCSQELLILQTLHIRGRGWSFWSKDSER